MVELTSIDILNGLLSIIQVILTIIIGGILIFKYFKYKNRPLLFMGLALILLTEVWFTHGLVLILVLTTGKGLSAQNFFILAYTLVPWTLVIWMGLITELIYKKYQKVVLIAYTIFGIIFEVIFYTFLFLDYRIIGELDTPVEVSNAPFMTGYLFIILINVLITGFLFFRESRRSNDPEIRLKGTIFVTACTLFVMASILDTFALNILALIMVRILLVLFSILTYGAFLLPKWMKKIFIKK
jgi:hypothetical protein